MKRAIAAVLVFTMVLMELPLYAGIPKNKSVYKGGTVASIPKEIEGPLSTEDASLLIFKWNPKDVKKDKDKDREDQDKDDRDKEDKNKDKEPPVAQWSVPYDKITSLAYGQHAGRRVGQTIAWGVTTLGIMALPILFSKKRRHYLTIEYTDDQGKEQAAVFEVGKETIRTIFPSLEARAGKKITYEDEEARKSGSK